MLFLIAALGGLAGIIFLVTRIYRAGRDAHDMASDIRGALRRGQWNGKSQGSLIDGIDDPREAAAILMVQIASYDGEVTARQKARMKELMAEVFDSDDAMGEGLYSFGRMAIGQINDAANSLSRLMRPIKAHLTLGEMKDLVRMLESVSEVEGPPTERQRDLVAAVRRALSLNSVS